MRVLVLFFLFSQEVLANPLGSLFRAPQKGTASVRLGLASDWSDQTSNLAHNEFQVGSEARLFSIGPGELGASGTFRRRFIGRDLRFDSGVRVEPSLDQVQFGLNYRVLSNVGHRWVFGLNYGSSSDDIFQRTRNNVFTGVGSVLLPGGESRWMLGLFYSDAQGAIPSIPLPLIAYFYQPNPKFRLIVGIPFVSLFWGSWIGPHFRTFLSPFRVSGKFSYPIVGPFATFVQFIHGIDSYLHNLRVVRKDRLYIQEQRVQVGVSGPCRAKNFFSSE